jgi:hypothetical protein
MVYECAICGTQHDRLIDRIECETKCLAKQEEIRKKQDEEAKKKAKMEAEAAINKELDNLFTQYDKVAHMIADYCEEYGNEDIYDKVVSRYIPKSYFDFIF